LPLCALAPTSSPPLRAQDMFALLARTQVLPGAAHRVSGAGASTLDAQEACACSRAGAEFRIAQGALQQGVLPPASYNASTSDVDEGALLQDARAGVFVGRHCGCRERSLAGQKTTFCSLVQSVHRVRCGKRGTCSSRKCEAISGCVRVCCFYSCAFSDWFIRVCSTCCGCTRAGWEQLFFDMYSEYASPLTPSLSLILHALAKAKCYCQSVMLSDVWCCDMHCRSGFLRAPSGSASPA